METTRNNRDNRDTQTQTLPLPISTKNRSATQTLPLPISTRNTEENEIPNFWKMKVDPTLSTAGITGVTGFSGVARRRVAGGIILNQDLTQIILVKSRCSGKWGIPKGGVEDHESDIQGALREIYEECGLSIESPLMDAMAPCITYRGVRIFLFCYNGPQEMLNLNPLDTVEISECAWFSLESLAKAHIDFDLQKMSSDEDENNELSSMSTSPILSHPPILQPSTPELQTNKLPTISTKLFEDIGSCQIDQLDWFSPFCPPEVLLGPTVTSGTKFNQSISGFVLLDSQETQSPKTDRVGNCPRENADLKRLSITTLLRDLIKERLDAIKRKVITNMDNYQVIHGKIIINTVLANILRESKRASTRHVNIIHDIQERFPTVFYLPELIRVLETEA